MEKDWNARGDQAESERLRDWLETQSTVLGFWMERLSDRADDERIKQLQAHKRNLERLLSNFA